MLHVPGIWTKLHQDKAMIECYQLEPLSMHHQNFSDTHPRPDQVKVINLLYPEIQADLHVSTSSRTGKLTWFSSEKELRTG